MANFQPFISTISAPNPLMGGNPNSGGGYYPLPPPKKMGMNKGPNYRFCGKFSAIYLNYKCPKTHYVHTYTDPTPFTRPWGTKIA